MTNPNNLTDIYLEIGQKKIFAGALAWPGWCRLGRTEEAALAALIEYGPRYARVLQHSNHQFHPPSDPSELVIVERLEGNATTDFGAPDLQPAYDERPLSEAEHERLESILKACWQAFDETVAMAEGKTLRKGPRGGGRELDGIVEHVLEADRSYLSSLGGRYKRDKSAELSHQVTDCRAAMLEGLGAAVRGELPTEGPRGGKRWGPRYFIRRVVWHALDHLWEIEDRLE